VLLIFAVICADYAGLLQSHEGWSRAVNTAATLRANFLVLKDQYCSPD
jgi:hypothetical protein